VGLVALMAVAVKNYPSEMEVINEPTVEAPSPEELFEQAVQTSLDAALTASSTEIQEVGDKAAEEAKSSVRKAIEERVRKDLRDRVWSEDEPAKVPVRKVVAQSEIEALIIAYWPEQPEVALAVAKAESGLNPTASNWADAHKGCNGSFGIFQIGCVHGSSVEDLYNVEYNIKKARAIYDVAGSWQPWGAYTNKSYLAKM